MRDPNLRPLLLFIALNFQPLKLPLLLELVTPVYFLPSNISFDTDSVMFTS